MRTAPARHVRNRPHATAQRPSLLRMPLSLLFVALVNSIAGNEVRINNVEEFIQFKDNVNSGSSYDGTTVFLDSDLSFAGKEFEPIGTDSNYFRGVFDGQGHVISNLAMTSSPTNYFGLFGYSEGLTIRNVILDSSCSIAGSYSGSGSIYLGGSLGIAMQATDPVPSRTA